MLYGTDAAGGETANRSGITGWIRGKSQIIAVATATAASQAVTAVSSWFTPTSSNRFFVDQADAPSYARIKAYNGTSWSALIEGDTGWVAATEDAAFDGNSNVSSRRIGPITMLGGLVRPDSGTISAGATTGLIATLAAGHRPSADKYIPVVQWVAGGSPEYRADAVLEVKTNGQVRIINGASSAATGALLDGAWFVID